MHFLPNTEDADAIAEQYWPDNFKQVIQREGRVAIQANLIKVNFRRIYERYYIGKYCEFNEFIDRLSDMLVVGGENGADDGFDTVYRAFLSESPLSDACPYARYILPQIFSRKLREKIHQSIANDYSQDEAFQHAYKVGYAKDYCDFEKFIDKIASLIVTTTMNGIDDMLALIYRYSVIVKELPPARRNPKRLKVW